MAYHQMGSLSSQTSLAGPYDGATSRRTENKSSRGSRPKLPKIKSSPSNGALAAARSNHAKVHKRVSSSSATTSPTFMPKYLLQTSGQTFPASAHADPYSRIETRPRAKSKVKIKPLLRKFSSQENVSIDLSRSAAENEGLGIYTNSEISAAPILTDSRRGYHHRATSANSQISSTSTSSIYPYSSQHAQYSTRQTPRTYTPPIASYKTSLDDSTPPTSLSSTPADTTSYAPLPSSRRHPPALHIRTNSSIRPTPTNSSQTNLPGTPSSLRLQHSDLASPDMMSSTARSSLESAFRKRSRSNTASDPAAQAAAVQVLRQKFQEKEVAKDLRYQQCEARSHQKEAKRNAKREEEDRRTDEKRDRKRAKSNAASEKSAFLTASGGNGIEPFPSATPAGGMTPPSAPLGEEMRERDMEMGMGDGVGGGGIGRTRTKGDSAGGVGKEVQSQWALFWFRMRTLWLRLRRKMGNDST